jgi:hypothetical protein
MSVIDPVFQLVKQLRHRGSILDLAAADVLSRLDERKIAKRALRMMHDQVRIEWVPGQHVMTPQWYAEGAIQEAIIEALTGETRR